MLLLPVRPFQVAIPLLIGAATTLFAVAPRLRGARAGGAIPGGSERAGLLLACVYGGFFGAGLGIILSALLALAPGDADARHVNARKNVLASAAGRLSGIVAPGAVRALVITGGSVLTVVYALRFW
ncbi:hypothetical protein [Actinoplanes sp. HUAS TT8]|uniref:hypothetical protein n=1 Tax=Actinoplanes sp. HUAS TT8 TaxID=3447453 RepID=UPI003F51CEA1